MTRLLTTREERERYRTKDSPPDLFNRLLADAELAAELEQIKGEYPIRASICSSHSPTMEQFYGMDGECVFCEIERLKARLAEAETDKARMKSALELLLIPVLAAEGENPHDDENLAAAAVRIMTERERAIEEAINVLGALQTNLPDESACWCPDREGSHTNECLEARVFFSQWLAAHPARRK